MSGRDGGPAFPLQATERDSGYAREPEHGMSLRDWFAGQALAGIMANDRSTHPGIEPAILAYEIADAMLAAREAE